MELGAPLLKILNKIYGPSTMVEINLNVMTLPLKPIRKEGRFYYFLVKEMSPEKLKGKDLPDQKNSLLKLFAVSLHV